MRAVNLFLVFFLLHEVSFALQRSELTGVKSPELTRVADLDNDGLKDIVSAELNNESFLIFKQSTDGSFKKSQQLKMSDPNTFLMDFDLGHINEDEYPDLMAHNSNNKIVFFKGVGDGTFVESKTFSIQGENEIISKSTPDFKEVVVISSYIKLGRLSVYRIASSDNWKSTQLKRQSIRLTKNLEDFKLLGLKIELDEFNIGNFNADKYLDLAIVSTANDYIVILKGTESGEFEFSHILNTLGGPTSSQLTDIDNDGVNEILVGHYKSHLSNLYVMENNKLRFQQSFSTGKYASGFAWDPLSKKIFSINYYKGELRVFNNWAKTYLTSQPIKTSKEVLKGRDIEASDLNNDGKMDLVLTDFRGQRIVVLYSE